MGAPYIRGTTIEMKIVLLLAIVAAAFAAKDGSMPEELFEEQMHLDGTYAEASDRATELLAENEHLDTAAKRNACQKAADASISNVFREVQEAQKMLNRLNNGRSCATKNQNLINNAQNLVNRRNREVRTANNNLRKARRARVSWNFSFESLSEGRCGAFYRHGNWQAAKSRVNKRNRALNQAKANLTAAKNNLKVQIATAKKVRNQCRCNVQKNTKNQLKIAKKLTGERQKTILREMMVKCLVAARAKGKKANAAAAKCKNIRISAAYNRKLALYRTKWASGVSSANCNANKYRGGGSGINYKGYFYRSLGGASYNGHSNGCDSGWKTIPKGCMINPSQPVNSYMGRHYRWSTHVLCSKGVCHNTVGYSTPGNRWSGNHIAYSGSCDTNSQLKGRCRARTTGCSLRALLRCGK